MHNDRPRAWTHRIWWWTFEDERRICITIKLECRCVLQKNTFQWTVFIIFHSVLCLIRPCSLSLISVYHIFLFREIWIQWAASKDKRDRPLFGWFWKYPMSFIADYSQEAHLHAHFDIFETNLLFYNNLYIFYSDFCHLFKQKICLNTYVREVLHIFNLFHCSIRTPPKIRKSN